MSDRPAGGQGAGLDHVVVAVRDLDAAAAEFGELGFTLTPRARHPWGTANRLIQFTGGNFIELIEIDRPELVFEHDPGQQPPRFSFGAFSREFLADTEGMSMLVLAGRDSTADVERFRAAGIDTYAPFDFERSAPLPDGSVGKVAFSLAFATHPEMPRAGFFSCHNRYPETFWKAEFQSHGNAARGMVEVVMVAEEPVKYSGFLSAFSGGGSRPGDSGIRVSCGRQHLSVVTPDVAAARFPGCAFDTSAGPRFIGIAIECEQPATAFSTACGMQIEWRRPSSPEDTIG